MRLVAMAVFITCGTLAPALAATAPSGIGVSATVSAPCSIAAQQLLTHPQAATRSTRGACIPPASPLAIPAPSTTVTLTPDPVSGGLILTVSF
jgi:hypothetical protein